MTPDPLAGLPVVWSPDCLRHEPAGEVWLGVREPGTEVPDRGRVLLDAVAAAGAEIRSPERHGRAPLLAVHDAALVEHLATVWADWEAAGYPAEHGRDRVVPYVFPTPGLLAGLPMRDPAALHGRVGRYCYDTMTLVGPGSWEAIAAAADSAVTAAGLVAGGARTAYALCRPPGHHAGPAAYGGSCYLNNAAIAAQALRDAGAGQVAVIDIDAHHGNGTQAAFYDSDEVLFVSLHEYPLYPGTGALEEVGSGRGKGSTINVPFPSGTSGDAYRLALDELVVPAAERFSPSWLLVSAGFDGHRADPLTDLGLTAGDFADLTERVARIVPPGRRVFFLEGGYDLEALAASAGATVAALAGASYRPEQPSTGGFDGSLGAGPAGRPRAIVQAAWQLHERSLEG